MSKQKNDYYLDDECEIQKRESNRWQGFNGAVVAAIIGAMALLLSVLIQTTNSVGQQQPVIIVVLQSIFGSQNIATPTHTPDIRASVIAELTTTANSITITPDIRLTVIAELTQTRNASGVLPTSEATAIPLHTVPAAIEVCSPTKTGIGKSMFLDIAVSSGYVQYLGGSRFDEVLDGVLVTVTGPYNGRHELFQGAFCEPVVRDSPEDAAAKSQIERELRFGEVACDLGDCPIEVNLP